MVCRMDRLFVFVVAMATCRLATPTLFCDNDGQCVTERDGEETNTPSWANVQKVCNSLDILVIDLTCRTQTLSCRGRCGNRDKETLSCYCDAKCLVYEDCCHDFRENCPQQVEMFDLDLSHVTPVSTRLLEDTYVVIDSCPENTETYASHVKDQEGFYLSTDYVVTDSLTGLHFSNYSTFSCHTKRKETENLDSKPIFWSKALKGNGNTEENQPEPYAGADARMDKGMMMHCGESCVFGDKVSAFNPLCSIVSRYNSDLSPNNVTFTALEACTVISSKSGGSNVPLKFSVLSQISPLLDRTEILIPKSHMEFSWTIAECFGGVKRNTCRVKKCLDSHFMLGQNCLLPKELNLTLEFDDVMRRNSFNEEKLIASLENALKVLKHNYFGSLRSNRIRPNEIEIHFDVKDVTHIEDSQNQLPFTKEMVAELERLIQQDTNPVKPIPQQARVCITMANLIPGQLESNFQQRVDTPDKYSYQLLCDVIQLMNSTSASEWVVSSDYRDEGLFDSLMKADSESNSVTPGPRFHVGWNLFIVYLRVLYVIHNASI